MIGHFGPTLAKSEISECYHQVNFGVLVGSEHTNLNFHWSIGQNVIGHFGPLTNKANLERRETKAGGPAGWDPGDATKTEATVLNPGRQLGAPCVDIYLFMYLFICLFVCLFVYLFIYLFIYCIFHL